MDRGRCSIGRQREGNRATGAVEYFRLEGRGSEGRDQESKKGCPRGLCFCLRFPDHRTPLYQLLPLEGDSAALPDRRHVLVRILDRPSPVRPADRPLGHIHADVDRIHFCDDQHGARAWVFHPARPVYRWFDDSGVPRVARVPHRHLPRIGG